MALTIPKKYTVGGNYNVDTSAYASSTDPNAVALKAYDNQLNAYKNALQSAYDSQAGANIQAQNKLKRQYDNSRSNVYTNARLSAIGNNERLAALGLAGNLYDYARSGTSETSRIAQDIAMRKSLSGLDQSENEAYSDYQLALLQAQRDADANYANKAAEVEGQKIPYQIALAQALATASSGGGSGGGSYYSSSKKKSSGSKKSSGGLTVNFSSTSKKGAEAEVKLLEKTGQITKSEASKLRQQISSSKLSGSKTSR